MKIVFAFLISSIFPLLLTAQQALTINGQLINSPATEVNLKHYAGEKPELVTSATLNSSGEFSFTLANAMGGLYLLDIEGENIAYFFPQSAKTIHWKADYSDVYATSEISGSEMSLHMIQLIQKSMDFKNRLDSIEAAAEEIYTEGMDRQILQPLILAYKEIEDERRKYYADQIKGNPTSLAHLLFIDNLSEDDDFEYFEMLYNGIYPRFKGDPLAEQFHNKFTVMRLTAVGATAPEIELSSPDGPAIKLSSLRGKVVLIDFWASWCGPCRRGNPDKVALYNKFKDKDFEIYSVSLDRARENWLEAIKKDGLDWTHVSDLKFWQSEAAKTYGVTGIPYSVLIDKEGKIIAKRIRGEELEKLLEEILR